MQTEQPQRQNAFDYNRDLPIDYQATQQQVDKGVSIGFIAKWIAVFLWLIISVVVGMLISKTTAQLPDIKILETYRPNESTQIFDRNGTLIANIHGDEDRVVVKLKDISPNVQRAVMAIEDNRFYEHHGIDPRGTLRAFMANVSADEHAQGGSTLTQQLVKNLFLTPEKSYTRKIAEAMLALRVEKHYSKDKILEMYLNQVYFGNQSYGIEKAARRYFKKPAKRLTLAESAMIAGLLKAPEGLSPYHYWDAARRRQLEVLDKMLEYGFITPKQRALAEEEKLVLNSQQAKPSKHPYFVGYVIQELNNMYGEDVVRRGGLRVYTTMDDAAQTSAENAVYEGVTKAPGGSGIKQGALVAMDAQSGEIIAMVGGVDFIKNQFNVATMARRAVGSTFKPFVYLTGFRLGVINPTSPISDRPISYGNWSPHNWDGKYMGAMNIRRALTLSRNTPTVQVGMKVGIDEVIKTCQLAGITSAIDPNSSSLLGSSGVSLLELVTGYSTFARGGIYVQPTAIKRVEDSQGHLVKIDRPASRRVFEQDHVASLVDILIDVVEKGTGKNAILPGRVVAGKTGTTDQMRDIWFMGFTADMVAGVWMGDPKNTPMHGVFGANSAKVWHSFAEGYYASHDIPPQDFFTASNDYAAKNGLIHLVDRSGLADAKKRIKVDDLDKKPVIFGINAVKPKPSQGTTSDSPEGAPASEGASTSEDSTGVKPSGPVSSPVAPEAPKAPPVTKVLKESTDDKQSKFNTWDKQLDKVQKNLDN